MPDLTLSAAMDSFLAEEDPATVFLPLAGGTMDAGADINYANASRLREGLTDAGNGGAGGIAMVCSLDYEFKWEAGRLYVMGQDGFTIRVEQYGFSAVPTASDDATKGYVVGSRRILDNGLIYLCTDATEDAAVWVDVTAIKIEGGGIVVTGASNPTSGGANTGMGSFISGFNNHTNSGVFCLISGDGNHSNAGSYVTISGEGNHSNGGFRCQISGKGNHSNGGNVCLISGQGNYSNSGNYSTISGYGNFSNSGNHCQINGYNNASNSGNYSQISGQDNYTNSGTHCQISGAGAYSNHSNSGNYCTISGSGNFLNSGNHCSISGYDNANNSGDYSQILGYNNYQNSGNHCLIIGEGNYYNSGSFCQISGNSVGYNTLSYSRVHGGGAYARIIDVIARTATTGNTPTTLTLGGEAENATNRINIPADTAWSFMIVIVARETGTANAKRWTRSGLIGNNAGAVTMSALDGHGTDHTLGTLAASIAITADNTNDALKIVGTGVVSKNIKWTAQINITQVG